MKISIAVATILSTITLSGCVSGGDYAGGYDNRYDSSYPATKIMGRDVNSLVNPLNSAHSRVIEAERKSISRDMPYAVVE